MQEVKAIVSTALPVVVQLLERRVGDAPGTFLNVRLFGDVAALLCGRLSRGRLHWREALITHLLCMHLLPLSCPRTPEAGASVAPQELQQQQARLEALLGAQVYGLFHGSSLLCKVRARCMCLTHMLVTYRT